MTVITAQTSPADEPTAYEPTPVEDFDWPCDRQYAHGPHVPRVGWDEVGPGALVPRHIDCPGVKAHPATMAGTVWRKIAPVEPPLPYVDIVHNLASPDVVVSVFDRDGLSLHGFTHIDINTVRVFGDPFEVRCSYGDGSYIWRAEE